MLFALFSTGGTSALNVLWVRVSPEEPMVIGGTGEMDRLHNPSTSPYFASTTTACSCSPYTQDSTDPTPLRDGWDREMY